VKKSLIALAALAALAAPATAAASDGTEDPAKVAKALCVDQKQADPAAFEATYGKNAMRNCKRAARGTAEEETQNAAQTCKDEQAADPALFQTTYGTNGNGKNAYGKCVSQKTDEAVEEEVEEFKNAAKECRAERYADPAGFQTTYGTNENRKNAFGKCVSQKVNEDDEEPTPTA
jgi:hypothetical protein